MNPGVYSQSINNIKPILYHYRYQELRQTSLPSCSIVGGGSAQLQIKEERVEQIRKTCCERSLFNCGNSESIPINGKLSDLDNVTFLRCSGWFKKKMAHFIALNVSESWKVD